MSKLSQYVLIVGNIVDGVSVYGPFSDPSSAAEYAEANFSDSWLVSFMGEVPA